MDLLPPDALLMVGKVLTYGAAEYGDRNWEQGIPAGDLEAAMLRHLDRWKLHQENDPESGLPHLAHAAANMLMMLALNLRWTAGFDDRPFVYGFHPVLKDILGEMPPKLEGSNDELPSAD